jgi:nucleotide-binding universal stress UspA family protein
VNEREQSPIIRRIVVALDASPHSEAALEAALQMAARFEAELLGLYVEDVEALRIARIPFAREVGGYSGRSRSMSYEEMERKYRARVRQIRRRFQTRSHRAAVQAAFRVVRDRINRAIRSEAQEADMLIVGRSGWSQAGRLHFGSTARFVCCQDVPEMTLILHRGAALREPFLVVFDGSLRARKALHAASRFTETQTLPLEVLLIADDGRGVRTLRDVVREELQEHDVMVRFHVLSESSVMRLVDAIHQVHGGTLIVPASVSLIEEEASLITLLEGVDVPVLLVR